MNRRAANPAATVQPTETAEIAARLRVAVARLNRLLRSQDESGLGSTKTAALVTISAFGPMTLGEVAARERIAPPSVTKIVEDLVARGLVDRRVDPTDRRVALVSVTPEGREMLEANRTRRSAFLAERLAELDPAERDRLASVLDVLDHLVAVADDAGVPPAEPR